MKHSEETKKKIREAAKKQWSSNKNRKEQSERLKGNTNGQGNKGRKQSSEEIVKRSKAIKGFKMPEESKEKISEYRKGKPLSEETKNKISDSLQGRESWNKGLTKETSLGLQKISEKAKGHTRTRGYKHSTDSKRNMGLAQIKLVESRLQEGQQLFPGWNKMSCEFFEFMEKEMSLSRGYYATNQGEFQIRQLGYWLDYINFDLKLIIEWDEERHYQNNKLLEKDRDRQQEIQSFYEDFQFIRLREKDFKNFNEILNYINTERLFNGL